MKVRITLTEEALGSAPSNEDARYRPVAQQRQGYLSVG